MAKPFSFPRSFIVPWNYIDCKCAPSNKQSPEGRHVQYSVPILSVPISLPSSTSATDTSSPFSFSWSLTSSASFSTPSLPFAPLQYLNSSSSSSYSSSFPLLLPSFCLRSFLQFLLLCFFPFSFLLIRYLLYFPTFLLLFSSYFPPSFLLSLTLTFSAPDLPTQPLSTLSYTSIIM